MRIAFVFSNEASVGAIPFVDQIVALELMGIAVSVVAPSQNGSVPDRLFVQATHSQSTDIEWWVKQAFNVVFVYSLGFPVDVVNALKSAGTFVVIDCDSDGRISPVLWPLDHWRHYRDERHSMLTKARIAKLWLTDVLFSRRYENRFSALLQAVDLIRIESQCAADNLIKFARFRKLDVVEKRFRVIPFCAPLEVCENSIPAKKTKRVVIAGRLDSQQKNPLVLARLIERILAMNLEVGFDCFSRGDCRSIRDLSAKYPGRVAYSTDAPKHQVCDALRSARILLSASRWETLPVIGIEALCMGCTIVATPIDGYLELCHFERNGTVATSFHELAICNAFADEWRRWERGERNPQEISKSARSHYRPEAVAGRLVELMGEGMVVNEG